MPKSYVAEEEMDELTTNDLQSQPDSEDLFSAVSTQGLDVFAGEAAHPWLSLDQKLADEGEEVEGATVVAGGEAGKCSAM